MWKILVALAVGAVIGTVVPFNEDWKNRLGRLQFYGVLILLFFMGIAIGINKEVIANLDRIGLISISFAVATTFMGVMLTYLLTSLYLRHQKGGIR